MIRKTHTLKQDLILFCIATIIVVFCLQIVVYQYVVRFIIVKKSNSYFQETIEQVGKRVDLRIEQCQENIRMIADNQELKNCLVDLQDGEMDYYIAKYRIMREVLRPLDYNTIESICIFTSEYPPINCYYSTPTFEMDLFERNLLSNSLGSPTKEFYWRTVQREPYQVPVYFCITDETRRIGLLKIDFNERILSQIIDGVNLGQKGKAYLVGDDGNIIFAKNRNVVGENIATVQDKSDSIVSYTLNNNGWRLVGVIPYIEISEQISKIAQIFFTFMSLVLIAIIVFIYFVIQMILQPLNELIQGIELIQQGNLRVVLKEEGYNEFRVIIHSFNIMVEKVRSLIETTYQQQVLYRKAEMSALQAKLNPHFLYNTLDMIHWMLILKGEEKIGDAVIALSNILRYSISDESEFVTVSEDIIQLKNYLGIQGMRFEDKLQYSICISDEMLDLRIPKLLIQPLVENSIKYAFQDMGCKGRISIRGWMVDEDLVFEVADNGIGISKEKLQSILASENIDEKRTGIGIKIVNQRIKYIYGDQYGITIDSAQKKGTKVTIRMGKNIDANQEGRL